MPPDSVQNTANVTVTVSPNALTFTFTIIGSNIDDNADVTVTLSPDDIAMSGTISSGVVISDLTPSAMYAYAISFSDGSIKPTIHYATKLHATNCNKAITKLKQSCNTLVTTVLQFVA